MNISILTVFQQLYEPFLQTSLLKSAQKDNIISCTVDSFFSFVDPKERIDSHTFGYNPGMLIRPTVIQKAIEDKEKMFGKAFKIFFSPQGQKLSQPLLKKIARIALHEEHLLLVCSRYEGIDSRVEEEYADMVISLGDFVLMGGDIPAMALLEGMLRLVPGVVGKQESVEQDSFSHLFVDHPVYTEPVEWKNRNVPDIVRSGNHGALRDWYLKESAKKTVRHHFQWLRSCQMQEKEKAFVADFIPSHYVALLHTDVLVGGKEARVGNTSVTSIDIHDIARCAKTFGIKSYGIITPLVDQQRIVKKLLHFWHEGSGIDYNKNRYDAIKSVQISDSLDSFIEHIEKIEGKKPIVIATSAQKNGENAAVITYQDQSIVWKENRPVLLIFGTGQGLSPDCMKKADYILLPIHGFSSFNHLSVRTAVGIVLDRWLGINERETGVSV